MGIGHPHLVAAVNTGYFDFNTGAPTQPVIVKSSPLVMSSRHQRVIGFDAAGGLQSGKVHLARPSCSPAGKRTASSASTRPRRVTASRPTTARGAVVRYRAAGRPTRGRSWGRSSARTPAAAPTSRNGFVLMSHGSSATDWLSRLAAGTKAGLAGKVRSTLARLPGSGVLSQCTYPADGKERPMPVGLEISYVKPKVHHRRHHHQHH